MIWFVDTRDQIAFPIMESVLKEMLASREFRVYEYNGFTGRKVISAGEIKKYCKEVPEHIARTLYGESDE